MGVGQGVRWRELGSVFVYVREEENKSIKFCQCQVESGKEKFIPQIERGKIRVSVLSSDSNKTSSHFGLSHFNCQVEIGTLSTVTHHGGTLRVTTETVSVADLSVKNLLKALSEPRRRCALFVTVHVSTRVIVWRVRARTQEVGVPCESWVLQESSIVSLGDL